MRLRTFLILGLLVGVFVSPATIGQAEDNTFNQKTQFRVKIQESEWFNYPSHLALRTPASTDGNQSETFLCPEWGAGECSDIGPNSKSEFFGTVVFPLCESSATGYCIEKLELKHDDSEWIPAKFNRAINGPSRVAVPEIGFPRAGTVSLFNATASDSAQGIEGYSVYAAVEIYNTPLNSKVPNYMNLDLRVTPYKSEQGQFNEQKIASITQNGKRGLTFTSFGEGSVWSENGRRGAAVSFSQNTAARLTLRVPPTVTGWLGGRLSKAEIKVTKVNDTTNQLIIGGYPVTVGIASVVIDREQAPEYFKQHLATNPQSSGIGYKGSNGVYEVLNSIRPFLKDKSIREETRWSLESYPNSTNRCLNDKSKLVGIVTTNATVFNAVPPTFSDGVLSYKVSGLHYRPSGDLTIGQYDLVMRSEVARCLYSFTSAPVQGTVSITYENGQAQTATTLINEKDGWLYLGAYNFSYSNPTIKIKLTQAGGSGAVGAKPLPSQTPVASNKPIKTIMCIKKSVVKKVVGLTPKCPSGYKLVK
jgi:hypothetical protein